MLFHFIEVARAAETAAPQESVTQLLGLDWKLFIAQLVNFGIVLFVLTKYVFGPLSKNLEARRQRIQTSLESAKVIEAEAEALETKRQQTLGKARAEAAEILNKAKHDAEQVKAEVLTATKVEQERLLAQSKTQIAQETNEAVRAARGQLADIVVGASEKLLRQKIDKNRDEKLIKEMLEQLSE
jgi:F-type H+-transporting ATPase subunit b